MKLLIATGNPGKVKEFREMLGAERFAWSDLSAHRNVDGDRRNRRDVPRQRVSQSVGLCQQFDTWALADDSGLEVDALNRSPGVFSARWAEMNGAGKGDADNNALLLKQLANVPDEQRTARFVCVLALSDPKGRIVLTARDTVEGRIIHAPRGDNGFGYDPLFFIESSARQPRN